MASESISAHQIFPGGAYVPPDPTTLLLCANTRTQVQVLLSQTSVIQLLPGLLMSPL